MVHGQSVNMGSESTVDVFKKIDEAPAVKAACAFACCVLSNHRQPQNGCSIFRSKRLRDNESTHC